MVHDLNPKNLHITGIIFFAKSKKPYFQGIFGYYLFLGIIPKMPFFPKMQVRQFFNVKAP